MSTVVHRTPGLIDPRSFTLMGVSAKPNSPGHAIGMFGTGLKYAIATLVRMDASVTILIGRDRYTFSKKPGRFRDQDIEHIIFRRHRWSLTRPTTHELPFTTSYGKFWKPWMAFRELHSNTLDEGGITDMLPEEAGAQAGQEGFTTILVEHPEYTEAWETRDDIFLPEASRQRDVVKGVEIMESGGERLYYRGLRVHDLPKPSLHTYNFVCDMQLTEDRTLYLGDYYARQNVAMAVLGSEDEGFIERIVRADQDHWEHELEFPSYVTPGDAFRRVMTRRTRGFSRSSFGYFSSYRVPDMNSMGRAAPAMTMERIRTLVHPVPWSYDDVEYRIVDKGGDVVLQFPEDVDEEVARVLAACIMNALMVDETPEPPEEEEPPEMTEEEAQMYVEDQEAHPGDYEAPS